MLEFLFTFHGFSGLLDQALLPPLLRFLVNLFSLAIIFLSYVAMSYDFIFTFLHFFTLKYNHKLKELLITMCSPVELQHFFIKCNPV